MPPNTKGTSFLFDPKLIDELETKGRIKLFFKDMGGLFVQVQKNMSCTQKQKKLEFRTLETIISRYDANSKLLSTITSKCLNADAEVINALGVSKAVLDHVIFCHQEDSNWPLSDGKLLKTRFDDIFAATKYIKALEVIRKLKVEKNHQIKQLDVERKHLEAYKERADELHRNLEESTSKFNALELRKQDISERLKPVQKQLDFFMREAGRLLEAKAELDKIENEKSLLEQQIKELILITKDCMFAGDDDELRDYIRSFSQTTTQMRRDEEDATTQRIMHLTGELSKLSAAKSKLTVQIGVMENKLTTYQDRRKQMTEAAVRVCRVAGLDDSGLLSAAGEIEMSSFSEQINKFIADYVASTASLEREFREEDAAQQSRVDAERETKSKLDQRVQSKAEAIAKCRRTLDQINDELKSVQNDKLLGELSAKIDDAEATVAAETCQLVDLTEIKEQIAQIETERASIKQKVGFFIKYFFVLFVFKGFVCFFFSFFTNLRNENREFRNGIGFFFFFYKFINGIFSRNL
jgi:DNA repair protein RAD50